MLISNLQTYTLSCGRSLAEWCPFTPRKSQQTTTLRSCSGAIHSCAAAEQTLRNVVIMLRPIHLEIEEDHFRASAVLAITRATMSLAQEVVFVCVHLHERSDEERFVYTQFDGQSHQSFEEGADYQKEKQIVHSNRSKRRRLEGANTRGVENILHSNRLERRRPRRSYVVCSTQLVIRFCACFFVNGSNKVFDAAAEGRGEKIMPSTARNITAALLHRLGVRLYIFAGLASRRRCIAAPFRARQQVYQTLCVRR